MLKKSAICDYFCFAVLFFAVLISAPFVFSVSLNGQLRWISFALVCVLGLVFVNKMLASNFLQFIAFVCLTSVGLLFAVITAYPDATQQFKMLLLWGALISLLVFLEFMVSRSQRTAQRFVNTYQYFAIFLSLCSLFGWVYLTMLGPLELSESPEWLKFDGNEGYSISPFGISLSKPIFETSIYRSTGLFVEPGYFGIFCGLNIVLFWEKRKEFSKWFFYLLFIGGITSLSVTFVLIVVFGLSVRHFRGNYDYSMALFVLFLLISALLFWFFPDASSIEVRLKMFLQFWLNFKSSGVFEQLLGHGLFMNGVDVYSYSSGFLSLLGIFGIVGTITMFLFLFYLLGGSLILLLPVSIGLASNMLITWPCFWLTLYVFKRLQEQAKFKSI